MRLGATSELRLRFAPLYCLAVLCSVTTSTFAHPGGVDEKGCHTNRKTGDYHCHRSPGTTSSTSQANLQSGTTKALRPPQVDNTCYTGPRGGRYRIVNGKKRYGC
jgi:hypothetical protein